MQTLRLPSDLGSLERFREFVTERAADINLAAATISKIELVLEEILANHVMHAYKNKPGETEVTCFLRPDESFCLQIADWGPPFNPLSQPAPDTTAPLEERQIGGLGIHLVKNMADHLEYRREEGKNILTACFKKPER
jgi:serine/threonine-protein kinase RsbW